jgi:superfamily I DNA and/or RNA helicase
VPRFNPQRDVHTVDSFQGREADVVVVSLVRNNDREQLQSALGFLTQEERMNVLLSRASAQLIVIGCLPLLESFSSAPEIGKIGKIAPFVRGRGTVVPAGMVLNGGRR